MSQQPLIDLMPESIRRQCEMGARTGQLIGAIVVGVLIVVVMATQARWQLDRERERYALANERAETVQRAQQEATALNRQLAEVKAYMDMYERLALPLDISAIIATIVNELPPSITIESLDMEASERRAPRAARSVPGEAQRPPRLLVGELSGFAQTDDDIARLVMRLQNRDGFDAVTLDFTRTRLVRESIAREFRMSFRIDLDRPYEVIAPGLASAAADLGQEVPR